MRPHYETQDHLANEKEIMGEALAAWGPGIFAFKLNEHKHKIDYALTGTDRLIRAWVEIKDRPGMAFDTAREYWISLTKWIAGVDFARVSAKPFVLLIRFNDKRIRYLSSKDYFENTGIEQKIGINGRMDRGDPDDLEPVIYLPMRLFHELRGPLPGRDPGEEG